MPKLANLASDLVFKVAIAIPLYRTFDYLPPHGLDLSPISPGIRLEVPFGTGHKIGVLVAICEHSDIPLYKLKPVSRILDEVPLLSATDLELLNWASRYYHHPVGEVFSAAFPANLRSGKAAEIKPEQAYRLTEAGKGEHLTILRRSPKQQALLGYFQSHSDSLLSTYKLAQWNTRWQPIAKALMNKCLVEIVPVSNQSLVATHETKKATSVKSEPPCQKPTPALNQEQQKAVATIKERLGQFSVFLLDGVTGSGKTEVYMQVINTALERGQQVLVLVPEINLTPQLEQRFRERFPVALALSHSNLTDKQRHEAWLTMQQGSCTILLGTRSSLFTPMPNLGLIVLDEEHDTSYKQQEGFRFSARDVAVMRAKLLDIPVILGSATPSLESLHNADQGRYQRLVLSQRAGFAVQPKLTLLDIRNKRLHNGLSEALVNDIRQTLTNGEQALIFLNRRGFAPTLICHGCGWVARCKYCDANLVIHNNEQRLRCHHCGKVQRLLSQCPACNSSELIPLGLGTESVEDALASLFPDKNLVRLDRDSTQRKGSLERYLADINEGKFDLILGTQMLAKGHHFPNVTLVVIVDVDSGLFSIDYRATERLAQLIIQVAGRAGRADKPGKVILQTRHPDHALLNSLIQNGYRRFADNLMTERQQAVLPPFSHHALLRAQARKPEWALEFLNTVATYGNQNKTASVSVLGPVPAPMEKRAGVYRYQLLLQSDRRSNLQHCLSSLITKIESLENLSRVRWSLDVDPVDLY